MINDRSFRSKALPAVTMNHYAFIALVRHTGKTGHVTANCNSSIKVSSACDGLYWIGCFKTGPAHAALTWVQLMPVYYLPGTEYKRVV